jgi:hypothetical protein
VAHREFETSWPLVWAANNLLVHSGHLRGQGTELLAVAPDGTRREQLTNDVSEFEPAVSAKDGRIAFVRGRRYLVDATRWLEGSAAHRQQ